MTHKLVATASLEISELAVLKCSQCMRSIRPKEDWSASFLSEIHICEYCGNNNRTEALLRNFLGRERWPAIAQTVMTFTAVSSRVLLKNMAINEIDLTYLADSSLEAVEIYFRNHSQHIFIQASARVANVASFPEKLNVLVNAPTNQEYVEVDIQILYHRTKAEHELATRWYRIFSSFADKAESSFLYQAQSLVEGQLKQYIARNYLQISGTFAQIINALTPRLRGCDALKNCLSTFRRYSTVRNNYTHESSKTQTPLPMDLLLARVIQFYNIMETDKKQRIIVKTKLKPNSHPAARALPKQHLGRNGRAR